MAVRIQASAGGGAALLLSHSKIFEAVLATEFRHRYESIRTSTLVQPAAHSPQPAIRST